MKYPITPNYLASAPDPIVKIFVDLEEYILKDICRRFKLSGEATESAIAQMKILQERGADLEDIEKYIKKALNLSDKEMNDIFDRAVERNRKYYDHLIEKSDIVSVDSKGLDREIEAIRNQTHDDFYNLTQSMGFAIKTGAGTEFLPIASTYQKVLDDATSQVVSGGMDYNTAIKTAVKRLTDSGLQVVDYASGWHNRADVAARRAIMTGVSQLSAKYAEQTAAALGTDLREVTAHSGARDTGTGWQNHKSWQGKVYSVSGNHPKYPSIYEVCGWGNVDGLEGANCRHHHFPFVEGISTRAYTDDQLANIDPPPFEYQGRTYTAYEATQKQRQIETSMRKYKRDVIGYESAGLAEEAQEASIRLQRLSKEYRKFSKAAGLRTQPERAQVQAFGAKESGQSRSLTKSQGKILQSSGETSRRFLDVTQEWYDTAMPNSHTVQDLTRYTANGITYEVDGHNVVLDYSSYEKEIAELLEKEFGGELFMVPRVNNPQGVSTPDYLFRGKGVDLKTLGAYAGSNTLFNRIKKAKRQANCFVVDLTATKLDDAVVDDQIEMVFNRESTRFVDEIFIVRNWKIIKVVKRT